MPDNDILDVREAAEYLKLNEQTVRRLARDRALPSFKVGGAWRFKKSTLDSWANNQRPLNTGDNAPPSNGANGGSVGHSAGKVRRRVLVIDDEEAIRDIVQRTLELENYDVQKAPTGAAAVEMMRGPAPDLVFLDLLMPGMTGPDVIKLIREKWGMVPVVILTGYPSSDMMQKVLPYSPITLLSKPFTLEQLVDAARIHTGSVMAKV